MDIDRAKLLDEILRRFKGNVTVSWDDLRKELGQTRDYFLTENNIKYLLGERLLIENKNEKTIHLTDKGFATYTYIDKEGFVAKVKKERRNKWIKNIGFVITIATFTLLIYRTFYDRTSNPQSQNEAIFSDGKTTLDLVFIDSIKVRKHSLQPDSLEIITKQLTSEQVIMFVDCWNNAKSNGLCKYLPTHWIEIYLKNGKVRTFRINGQNIKEQKDWCFDLDDSKFIEELLSEM